MLDYGFEAPEVRSIIAQGRSEAEPWVR